MKEIHVEQVAKDRLQILGVHHEYVDIGSVNTVKRSGKKRRVIKFSIDKLEQFLIEKFKSKKTNVEKLNLPFWDAKTKYKIYCSEDKILLEKEK
jgi:hypothetical protein